MHNKSRKDKKEKTDLGGHGDLDIIYMLRYSKNKRKLANQLMWNYYLKMSPTQKAACRYNMQFWDIWKVESYYKYGQP